MDYHNLYPDKVWGAVVFDSSESYEEQLPADIRFDLRVTRMSKGDKWLTDFTYNFIQTTSPRNTDANGGNPSECLMSTGGLKDFSVWILRFSLVYKFNEIFFLNTP